MSDCMTGVANDCDSSSAEAELQLTLCFLAVHGGTSAPMVMQVHPGRWAWGCSEAPAWTADTCHDNQLVRAAHKSMTCTQEAWEITLR